MAKFDTKKILFIAAIAGPILVMLSNHAIFQKLKNKSLSSPGDLPMTEANSVFLRNIFLPSIANVAPQDNIAFSPVGVHFMSTMLKNLISVPLLSDWDRLASATDLIRLNKQLQGRKTITSKSAIAGMTWASSVPSKFKMDNFKVFQEVNVNEIKSYLGVDVDELKGSTDAAVHYLKFNGRWGTKFDGNRPVRFSDGVKYSFMEATVPSVPWFENDKLTMVTLPFMRNGNNEEDVCIDFILPHEEGSDVDLDKHKEWLSKQDIEKKVKIIMPKVKLTHKDGLALSTDPGIISLQKVEVEWDESGVKAEAVTMSMARSLPPPIPTFIAERTFFFIIRQGSLWLFLGRISSVDPKLNEVLKEYPSEL